MTITSSNSLRRSLSAAVVLHGLASPAFAAAISDSEFESLLTAASATPANSGGGGVHVAIKLSHIYVAIKLSHISLGDAGGDDPAKMADLRFREQALLQELGMGAWLEGRWNGGLGVIGMYVDASGLQTLRASNNALSFSYAVHPDIRSHRFDPRFVTAEKAIGASGYAEVIVQVRSETAALDITSAGSLRASGGMNARAEHTARSGRILSALRSEDVSNLAEARARANAAAELGSLDSLDVQLRINGKALVALVTHPDVGSIRLAGAAPSALPEISEQALQAARDNGRAEVVLAIRNPMRQARETRGEIQRRAAAQARAFSELMAANAVAARLTHLPQLGVFTGHLNADELERLAASRDPRLLGIANNAGLMEPHLSTATSRMQMAIPWNHDAALHPEPSFMDAGYRGAYPSVQGDPGSTPVPMHVIVMDGGIFSANPMLSGKVVTAWGSCFGTFSASRESVCPGAVESSPATWDTPFPVANGNPFGAGETPVGHWWCASRVTNPTFTSFCDHGTLIAGIAAGRTPSGGPLPLLRGVAPSAKLVSLMTSSMPKQSGPPTVTPASYGTDFLGGLQSVLDATDPNTVDNDFVVNISSGTPEVSELPCATGVAPAPVQVNGGTVYNDAFATAVQLLRARGIPVIASAGNAQSRSGVAWLACIPGVVKVGAMLNVADITAFSIPQFNTNLVSVVPSDPGNPSHPFVGEHFFLGSGASGAIGVLSSRASTQFPYGRDNGTSFAAPQVTGAYAVVKAAYRKLGLPYQVDWASLWLRSSASLDVEDGFDLANPKRKHKAIRFTAVP